MKKWIAAVVVVVIVIAAAFWYKAGSAPAVAKTPETAATPAPTATPEATPAATPVDTEDPTATETPADTGEYTIENYNKITDEEWAAMSDEEKQKWREVRNKELGFQSWDDLEKISEEKTQEAFDILNDPNNPYVQEILEYKASLNN